MRLQGSRTAQHQAGCSTQLHKSLPRCFRSSSSRRNSCTQLGGSYAGSHNCNSDSRGAHSRHRTPAGHTDFVQTRSPTLFTCNLGNNSSTDCTINHLHLTTTTCALSVFLASTILLFTPHPHSASASVLEQPATSDSSSVTQQHASGNNTTALNTAPSIHPVTNTVSSQTSDRMLDQPSATTANGMTHSATAMEMGHTAVEAEINHSAMGMSHAVAAPGTSAALFHCNPLSGEERLDAYGPVDRYSQR